MAFVDDGVRAELPTHPANRANALVVDTAWWVQNGKRMRAAFDAWLAEAPVRALFYRSDGG